MSAILVKSFVGQAERYKKKELSNKRETYYSDESARFGQWTGKGAEKLGLKGDISSEDFSRLSRGIDLRSGERFRRMILGRTREVDGKLKRVKEIGGWDLVISAPKSVSQAAIIGGDERVRAAHLDSVTDALERAEQQAQANLGGGKKQQTGNLIVGRFSHDSARPSKDGFVAPQLHDHCFIMNATFLPDGTLKPLESLELHRAQSYIRTVYYVGLADRLQKLGYEIEIDPETGAPEITGISKEYRLACSPRRTSILELAKEAGRSFRQLGLVKRGEKVFDKDLIQGQHKAIDGLFDYQAQRVVEKARGTAPIIKPDSAKESVAFALAKLSKRESVFNPRVVLLEANKRGIGQTTVAAIEAELDARKKDGPLKTIRLRDGREAVFLSVEVEIESDLSHSVKSVQSKETLREEYSKNISPKEDAVIKKEFAKFNQQQRYDLVDILNAETDITILEESFGGEKITTLSFISKFAEKADYEVLGLAPATGAAQELDNAKIRSSTLQKLLASTDAPRDRKRFFIVDELNFVSSRQMDKFFRDAVKTGDRVLLVEDARRREGVKTVKPLPVPIQSDELGNGTNVETIKRQTKKSDRETVKNLPEEKIIEAVSEMRERGQVREIKDRAERHNSIVEAFTSEPEKSLVVAPKDADRQEINLKIHQTLKESGKIRKEEIEIKILRPRNDISGTEREFAAAYKEDDRITYTRGSKENEIPTKSLARVVKIDREQNLLTVEIKDGGDGAEAREITYNPKRLRGVGVWTQETIKVSEGDRLQFRASFEEKETKIADGAMFEVSKITAGVLTLQNDKGKIVKLKTDQPHAIDYGYAAASQSSQSKTITQVLIHAETTESKQLLNETMARVTLSRAKSEALIFTDDEEKLVEKMARQVEKLEISQTKTETIECAPERVARIILDAKMPVETDDESEIKPLVILPSVGELTIPAIVIEPNQQTAVVYNVKSEAEPEEVKSSATVPLVTNSVTPAIEIQPAQADIFPTSYSPTPNQEILIKELVQVSRTNAEEQGLFHSEKAWSWLETVEFPDLGMREIPEKHRQFVDFLQKDLPEFERVNLYGKSKLESTHAILKLIPIEKRETIVNGFFADYYKLQNISERVIEHTPELIEKDVLNVKPQPVKVEHGEINQPEMLSKATTLSTPEIKTPQIQQKPAESATDTRKRQEILVSEVLQMSRESLAKQGIKPDPEAWKRFANVVSNDLPAHKAHESQERTLEAFEEIAPLSERVSLTGESSLEAIHAILKTAPESQRNEIVKTTLARYEKQVIVERSDTIKPEIKESAKTASFEKTAPKQVKPMPKIRNFEAIGRIELIRELVADARDAARTRAGEDFSHKQEKRLTKMYRQVGDNPPTEQQTNSLKSLQERFSAPLPQPKNFIEATVLILDNSTDAEKFARLRGQMIKIDELIEREEARKIETAFERTGEDDPFGRTDSYFTQELHRRNFETPRKPYLELIKEAEQRNLVESYTITYETYERMQEKYMQQALYQMGIANALQEQMRTSLEEQGIKIEPSAQKLMNNIIDTWAKQPPSAADYKNVEEINQSRGTGITPRTKLEANAYVFAKTDDGTRDKISSSLAAEAGEKAAELKVNQAQELKRNREMTQENPYTEGQTQTRGLKM